MALLGYALATRPRDNEDEEWAVGAVAESREELVENLLSDLENGFMTTQVLDDYTLRIVRVEDDGEFEYA